MENTKFELLVDNELKVVTGEQIIGEVKRIMDTMYIHKQEDGTFSTDIYVEYDDRLSDAQVKDVTSSKDPMMAFYEVLDDFVTECTIHTESDFFSQVIQDWDEEEFGEYYEYEHFIQDWVMDNVFFNFPYEHYLNNTDVQVNLVVDTGDGDYDYTLNNFLSYNGDGTIEPESSILWLVEQQGYTSKDLIEAIEEGTENTFLKSVVGELENVTSHMNALTFFVRMNLKDYIDFIEKGNSIALGRETNCGLMDFWSGAGSLLDIKLESGIELTKDIVQPHVDGNRGYGVDKVYGMAYDFWTESVDGVL